MPTQTWKCCSGAPQASLADEGGVSFWLPGTFGSLAAVPDPDGRFAGVNPLEREPFEHGIAYDQSRTTFPDWPDRMTSNAFK